MARSKYLLLALITPCGTNGRMDRTANGVDGNPRAAGSINLPSRVTKTADSKYSRAALNASCNIFGKPFRAVSTVGVVGFLSVEMSAEHRRLRIHHQLEASHPNHNRL